ncbi:hypothetical protein NDU88_002359 [Pleurodeles waltl]|uniref:Uncharacterized protein n=1 Tax=Pleurodeles waltl TaxID=8319 RepID=A0AAV7UCX8_PLEWA|nr:hypothetical protein NDU88_002359 [Pleurodeles waltl]
MKAGWVHQSGPQSASCVSVVSCSLITSCHCVGSSLWDLLWVPLLHTSGVQQHTSLPASASTALRHSDAPQSTCVIGFTFIRGTPLGLRYGAQVHGVVGADARVPGSSDKDQAMGAPARLPVRYCGHLPGAGRNGAHPLVVQVYDSLHASEPKGGKQLPAATEASKGYWRLVAACQPSHLQAMHRVKGHVQGLQRRQIDPAGNNCIRQKTCIYNYGVAYVITPSQVQRQGHFKQELLYSTLQQVDYGVQKPGFDGE